MEKVEKEDTKEEIISLINTRIEKLRPKLLDLSRRNPLLSTKFSDRSNSHVRIVDELPEVLFEKILQSEMTFAALPPLDDDPRDEHSREFREALTDARITDQDYKNELDGIDPDADDAAEKLAAIERTLKDKIRSRLGLPPRQTKKNLSLVQHARNNHILPSYELPMVNEVNADGRHGDDKIQTLFLPDLLQSRMDSLLSKCRTWIQETGINVLRIAFGFLEWAEASSSKPCFAPLILLPVEIEKEKSENGYRYVIRSNGESPEKNIVLAEKMRLDFGVELPAFNLDEIKLEEYFDQIRQLTPKQLSWKIRRQIAVGVFPSARMAMYHDLNTEVWNFADQPVIRDLFGGVQSTSIDTPFGDDYEIDSHEIETKVPLVVTEADSSQFSTIVDVMNQKNLAVEGPPGTGKSQTIVNVIAAALASNKKVLFVAEKTAALEVVRSRLAACGLGEFLLPLQATRASKEQVIQSLRDRLDIDQEKDDPLLDVRLKKFRSVRALINEYVSVVSSQFGKTGKTVYEILGSGIIAQCDLKKSNNEIYRLFFPNSDQLTKDEMESIVSVCGELEALWEKAETQNSYWTIIGRANIDPFAADEILATAMECSIKHRELAEQRTLLEQNGLSSETPIATLSALKKVFSDLKDLNNASIDLQLVKRIVLERATLSILAFLNDCKEIRVERDRLKITVLNPLDIKCSTALSQLADSMDLLDISILDIDLISQIKCETRDKVIRVEKALTVFKDMLKSMRVDERAVTLGAIYQLCKIAVKTHKDVLARRSEALRDTQNRELLVKGQKRLEEIKAIQLKVENEFNLPIDETNDTISSHFLVLSSSGWFSFMQPRYHRARKFYKSISINGKVSKVAVTNLKRLIAWKKELEAFNADQRLQNALGTYFEGDRTDFVRINQLFDFYDEIERSLKGLHNQPLRDFLCTATYDTIINLPSIEDVEPLQEFKNLNFSEINELKTALNNKVSIFEEQFPKIKECCGFLVNGESLSSEKLRELAARSKLLNKRISEIENREHIKGLLLKHFRGIETYAEDLKIPLTMAEKILSLDKEAIPLAIKILEESAYDKLIELFSAIIEASKNAEASLSQLAEKLHINPSKLQQNLPPAKVADLLSKAAVDKIGLLNNSIVAANKKVLSERGYEEIINTLFESLKGYRDIAKTLQAIVHQSQARHAYERYGTTLCKFNGIKLNEHRKTLAALDREILLLSRKRVRAILSKEKSIPAGIGVGRRSEWTNMALINNEVAKKSRYIPVRDLTNRAGDALLELKPCWMMSPLAVAQYIEKGAINFDLVVIDEASQMTPEDAVGAISRGSNVVVVGDTNQLPPTSFFEKFVEDPNDDPDEVVTEESILEMANMVFRPARRLKWHYRSQHPGLIAFSNKYVYEDDLVVFPSAHLSDPNKGVEYKKINGLYSGGTNPIEAREMASEIQSFMHTNKRQSLGVVLLNQRQMDLLRQEVEYMVANDPVAQEYVAYWEEANSGLEYFFIKNLENVQGDERDVIFIGTVYGPETEGARVMQRFGPINGVTGKRRLNVLFTRAKHRIVTFSSMTSNDIEADSQSNEGVFLLKSWLEYCASGTLLSAKITGKEPDSDFERYVIQQLKGMGCIAEPQVGVSGYFIDIGVRHPKWPHGYIMGVECDGVNYHSSKSARDRDRLRQEVLEKFGWHLHRIWSTDWFNDPVNEAEWLRRAVDMRLSELLSKTKA